MSVAKCPFDDKIKCSSLDTEFCSTCAIKSLSQHINLASVMVHKIVI